MGWSKDLIADKNIEEEDIRKIIKFFPEELKGFMGAPYNDSWGWSAVVDINKPSGNKLTISGAHYSSDYASVVAKKLKKELIKKGYTIKIERTFC